MFRYAFVFLCAVLMISNVALIDARKNQGGRYALPTKRGRGPPVVTYNNAIKWGRYIEITKHTEHTTRPSTASTHGYTTERFWSGGGGNWAGRPSGRGWGQYHAPQQISYASPHGAPMGYPVFRGDPPTYVYQYKNSGSKYRNLLTGLALFDLGRRGTTKFYSSRRTAQPGEVCLFGIKKDNGDYEQTRIDCQLISSFIYEDMVKRQSQPTNTKTVTTTVTNSRTLSALEVKGSPVRVTPGMECFVIRKTSNLSTMKKTVPCGLLQIYADKSFRIKLASAAHNVPAFTITAILCAVFVMY